MSTVKNIKVTMTVDDPKATFYDMGNDVTTKADVVWWEWSATSGLEVTVFGDEDSRGCQGWMERIESEWDERPAWLPTPPSWFRAAVNEKDWGEHAS